MKNPTFFLLAIMLSLTVFGQKKTEKTIEKANALIAQKKYASAFKELQDFDPKNGIPDIVLLKERIALNYFVTSIMHQMFAFRDLKGNQNILNYRGRPGSFPMYHFPVDKVLDSLIKVYPDNCALYKGLGDFYYEVYLRYNGHWLKNDNELLGLIEKNDTVAVKGNCADYMTYYVLGYVSLYQKKYKKAITYFLESIDLNKNYADACYNLAYAYLYTNDRKNALKYAKISFKLYTDPDYKSDAARMIGEIYSELNDDKNAIRNYEIAEKLDSNNYYNLRPLLELYVKTGNPKADQTLHKFFWLDPTNPTIYNDLGDIYIRTDHDSVLIAFFKKQLAMNNSDPKIIGNLNFYLGKVYLGMDNKLAKQYFLQAKAIFSKIYDKDHQVFTAIDQGLKEAEK